MSKQVRDLWLDCSFAGNGGEDPLFTRLFMLAEISKFTPEEKKQYDKSIENMGDYCVAPRQLDESEVTYILAFSYRSFEFICWKIVI